MRFELISYTEFNRNHFKVSKTWAQYYEPDDIEALSELGFDREEVYSKLKEKNWSDDYWFPIPDKAEIGTFKFEHRLAQFETKSGKSLSGYIVNSGYSICLFGSQEEWNININLLDLLRNEVDNLKMDIGLSPNEDILPIKVSIPFKKVYFTFAGNG